MTSNDPTRRDFLIGTLAGAATIAWPSLAQEGKSPWKIGGFTKVLQDLSYDQTAQVSVDVGWDGIECPVRAKGQVLPERVEEDLPKMVEALKAKGQEILVLATDIHAADEPLTEKVLRTAVRLGIRLYRLGPFRYKEDQPISRQLEAIRAKLKELAALNREIGTTGLLQNHSGNGYVGAPLWDLHELLKDTDPRHLGVHYDIGHATVEGGLSWPTTFALVKDRIGAVIVKDFHWKTTPGQGATTVWVPIGQGNVQPKFVAMLRASGFSGPITMQFEYPFEGGASLESRVRALKADNATLRGWLKG
jgi:sugar phosphate isomerase/epimerase